MAHTETINGQNGSNWQLTLPDQITLTQSGIAPGGPFFLDAAHPTLTFSVHYDAATAISLGTTNSPLTMVFQDIVGEGEDANPANGFLGPVDLVIYNELGVPIGVPGGNTFQLFLDDASPAKNDAINDPSGHPIYTHFHTPTAGYGNFVATPGTFSGAGTPGAFSKIDLAGQQPASGADLGSITLHARDLPNSDDSFSWNIQPGAQFLTDADRATFSFTADGAKVAGTAYSGPVTYLQWQLLGADKGEIVIGTTKNDFVNLLGGDDAADAGAGDDVIDGGRGSNFLTGGSGKDVFFLDGRSGGVTWGTITDWQAGEELSLWGWRPGISRAEWVDQAGAPGFQGATMHADLDGDGSTDASVTFSNLTRGQLPTPTQHDGLLWFH